MKRKAKSKIKAISNLPVRLSSAERPVLLGIADRLGLTYKSRPSIGQILHYLATGKALIMLHSFDTSSGMIATAARLRTLLNVLDQDSYEQLEQVINSLASSLDAAATIRSEFEQAEVDEIKTRS